MQGTERQTSDMTPDKVSQVLTPEEVAAGLKVSPKTVMRLLRTRRMRGVKVGGQWRVPVTEYNRVLREGVGGPRA
jgi:excisionase family DNA binding protein